MSSPRVEWLESKFKIYQGWYNLSSLTIPGKRPWHVGDARSDGLVLDKIESSTRIDGTMIALLTWRKEEDDGTERWREDKVIVHGDWNGTIV